ncbi:hypothetical protein B0H15DRAFT_929660 [Mycena belliarum]|uniref:Uncharacterized protein n=1 Tax=Mycena belliarum TaxID=1033014 RepID=A0AAD6XP46_9AGAR|nr:hypothetical protein B0H15DRAFT_929660 [Mycena belliae]
MEVSGYTGRGRHTNSPDARDDEGLGSKDGEAEGDRLPGRVDTAESGGRPEEVREDPQRVAPLVSGAKYYGGDSRTHTACRAHAAGASAAPAPHATLPVAGHTLTAAPARARATHHCPTRVRAASSRRYPPRGEQAPLFVWQADPLAPTPTPPDAAVVHARSAAEGAHPGPARAPSDSASRREPRVSPTARQAFRRLRVARGPPRADTDTDLTQPTSAHVPGVTPGGASGGASSATSSSARRGPMDSTEGPDHGDLRVERCEQRGRRLENAVAVMIRKKWDRFSVRTRSDAFKRALLPLER